MHIRPYLPKYPFADEGLVDDDDQLGAPPLYQSKRIVFGFRSIVLLRLLLLSALLAAISHLNLPEYFVGNATLKGEIGRGYLLLSLLQSALLLTMIFLVCKINKSASIAEYRANSAKIALSGSPVFALNCFIILLGMQIIMASVMRGSGAQYAVTDFPTIAGQWFPSFSADLLIAINGARSDQGLPDVNGIQVLLHVTHRIGALLLILSAAVLMFEKSGATTEMFSSRLNLLVLVILLAFIAGACAVLFLPTAASALGLVHSFSAYLVFALALQTSFDGHWLLNSANKQ